uniref:Uncharacterized protein n=1 Tax=Romanomermis culicivorax TaxID=13658 RepID=A0A915LAU2_ROMCU
MSAQGYGLPTLEPTMPATAVVSAQALSPALPLLPKYAMPVNVNPSRTPKMTGNVSMVTSYGPREGTPAPPAY